jgi:UDP-N-acetylglucosamine transferase subunit ALG13
LILTIIGTHEQPFNRLLQAVDVLPTSEERIVQTGHSTYQPQHATCLDFMPFDRVKELMQQARVVITHAGTGTVMLALSLGKVPVVAPRLAKFGEHVDDHQVELVTSLADMGCIIPYFEGDDLAAKIEQAATTPLSRAIQPAPALVAFLKQEIDLSV